MRDYCFLFLFQSLFNEFSVLEISASSFLVPQYKLINKIESKRCHHFLDNRFYHIPLTTKVIYFAILFDIELDDFFTVLWILKFNPNFLKCLLDVSINESFGLFLSDYNIRERLRVRKKLHDKVIMKECVEKNALDDNLEVCHKCKNEETIIFKDLSYLPKFCPRLDEINKLSKNFSKSIDSEITSLASAMKPLINARNGMIASLKNMYLIPKNDINIGQLLEPLPLTHHHLTQTELKLLNRVNDLESELAKVYREILPLREIIEERIAKRIKEKSKYVR